MHKLSTIYCPLVHASDVREGAEHGACRAKKMENCKTNGHKCAHLWWGQKRYMSELQLGMP